MSERCNWLSTSPRPPALDSRMIKMRMARKKRSLCSEKRCQHPTAPPSTCTVCYSLNCENWTVWRNALVEVGLGRAHWVAVEPWAPHGDTLIGAKALCCGILCTALQLRENGGGWETTHRCWCQGKVVIVTTGEREVNRVEWRWFINIFTPDGRWRPPLLMCACVPVWSQPAINPHFPTNGAQIGLFAWAAL